MTTRHGIKVEYSFEKLLALAQYADALGKRDGEVSAEEKAKALAAAQGAAPLVIDGKTFTPEEVEAYNCLLAHPLIQNRRANLTPDAFARLPERNPTNICAGELSLHNAQGLQNRLRLWRAPIGAMGKASQIRLALPHFDHGYVLIANGDPTEARHRDNVKEMVEMLLFFGFPPENIYVASSAFQDVHGLGMHTAPGTVDGVESLVGQLREREGSKKLLWLYTTGHGIRDGAALSLALENHEKLPTKDLADWLKDDGFTSVRSMSDQCFGGIFPDYLVEALADDDVKAIAPNTAKESVVCGYWTPEVTEAAERGVDLNADSITELKELLTVGTSSYNRNMRANGQGLIVASYRQSAPALHMKDVAGLFAPNSGKTIVVVTAPWCHVCKEMEKQLDNFRATLREDIQVLQIRDGSSPEGIAILDALRARADAKMSERTAFPTFIYLDNGKITGVTEGYKTPVALRADVREYIGVVMSESSRQLALANLLSATHGVPLSWSLEHIDQYAPEAIAASYFLIHGTEPSTVIAAGRALADLPMQEYPNFILNFHTVWKQLPTKQPLFAQGKDLSTYVKILARHTTPRPRMSMRIDSNMEDAFQLGDAWKFGTDAERTAIIQGLALQKYSEGVKWLIKQYDTISQPELRVEVIAALATNQLQDVEKRETPKPDIAARQTKEELADVYLSPRNIEQLFQWFETTNNGIEKEAVLTGLATLTSSHYAKQIAAKVLGWTADVVTTTDQPLWEKFVRTARYFAGTQTAIAGQYGTALRQIAQRAAEEIGTAGAADHVMEQLQFLRMVAYPCPSCRPLVEQLLKDPKTSPELMQIAIGLVPRIAPNDPFSLWNAVITARPEMTVTVLTTAKELHIATTPTLTTMVQLAFTHLQSTDRAVRAAAVQLLIAIKPGARLMGQTFQQAVVTGYQLMKSRNYDERILGAQLLQDLSQRGWPSTDKPSGLTPAQANMMQETFFQGLEDPSEAVAQYAFVGLFMLTGGKFLADQRGYLPINNPSFAKAYVKNVLHNPQVLQAGNVEEITANVESWLTATTAPDVAVVFIEAFYAIRHAMPNLYQLIGAERLNRWATTLGERAEVNGSVQFVNAKFQWDVHILTGEARTAFFRQQLSPAGDEHPELQEAIAYDIGKQSDKQIGFAHDLAALLARAREFDGTVIAHTTWCLTNMLISREKNGLRLSEAEQQAVVRVLQNTRHPYIQDSCLLILKMQPTPSAHDTVMGFIHSEFDEVRQTAGRYFRENGIPHPAFLAEVKAQCEQWTPGDHAGDVGYLLAAGQFDYLVEHPEFFDREPISMYPLDLFDELQSIPDRSMGVAILNLIEGNLTQFPREGRYTDDSTKALNEKLLTTRTALDAQ